MALQYPLEILAVVFSAATGPLVARNKRVDLFGVIVLGLVTAVGGGTLRDLVLGVPVFWLRDSSYIWAGTLAASATFFLARYVSLPQTTLLVADAGGLAFVTILGTAKTLAQPEGYPVTVCALFGMVGGVAGGMLRDVLVGQLPIIFRADTYLYATAALFGASVYLLLECLWPHGSANLVLGTLITLLLRLIAVKWKLGLPVFMADENEVA